MTRTKAFFACLPENFSERCDFKECGREWLIVRNEGISPSLLPFPFVFFLSHSFHHDHQQLLKLLTMIKAFFSTLQFPRSFFIFHFFLCINKIIIHYPANNSFANPSMTTATVLLSTILQAESSLSIQLV